MKNLSIEEKKDLDICVFQNLTKENSFSFDIFLKNLFLKIKAFIHFK